MLGNALMNKSGLDQFAGANSVYKKKRDYIEHLKDYGNSPDMPDDQVQIEKEALMHTLKDKKEIRSKDMQSVNIMTPGESHKQLGFKPKFSLPKEKDSPFWL